MKIPSEAKRLKLVRLKPRQSVTSSNKQKCKWISSLWNILNCRKSGTFGNEGTFTYASSVQEVQVIFEWNNLQSLGKALVYLLKHDFCITVFYLLN